MDPRVKLGHMACYVEDVTIANSSTNHTATSNLTTTSNNNNSTTTTDLSNANSSTDIKMEEVTFLFQLSDGCSPKSYGINVARLAGLPLEVIQSAIKQSQNFENFIQQKLIANNQQSLQQQQEDNSDNNTIMTMDTNRWNTIQSFFEKLVSITESHNYHIEELASYAKTLWQRYHLMKESNGITEHHSVE